jgi:ankyrin repeat protein
VPPGRAAWQGYATVVHTLVKAGAQVDLQNKGGGTALIWAATNGHAAIVEALMKAGAEINIQDEDGWTALDHSTRSGANDNAVRALLRSTNENWTVKVEGDVKGVAGGPAGNTWTDSTCYTIRSALWNWKAEIAVVMLITVRARPIEVVRCP